MRRDYGGEQPVTARWIPRPAGENAGLRDDDLCGVWDGRDARPPFD
jgi:hypothetical protein